MDRFLFCGATSTLESRSEKSGEKTIFLSDAHLKGIDDVAQKKISRFLSRLRGRSGTDVDPSTGADTLAVDHLVIAGDFFDFWFARGDLVFPGFEPVIEKIAFLKRQGVRITLCEGNHDFFLADYFTRGLGIDVCQEWADLEINGLRFLISHGDTIDKGNRKYLALRRFLRSDFSRTLQRLLPLKVLWRLARFGSLMSNEMTGASQDQLAETMYRFALRKFEEGYDAVVLGHCHKAILRETVLLGRKKTFATLGDWILNDTYLSFQNGRFAMNRFSPNE